MLMFDFPLSMNEYNSLLKSLLYVDKKKNGENLINHELQEAFVHVYMSFQRWAWMMMIFVTDIYEKLNWQPSFIKVSYNCFND